MKFAEKLVGKGLSGWVITLLITYNLAWMVVLVVPMAVLTATLMAFGNMSQNNEVAIMKASGISLYRMVFPPLVASVFVALFLVYFNNKVYPDANHAARLLMEDISRKKPTLSLVPGVFSQDVNFYSILVRDINQATNELGDITIYDYSSPPKVNIVTASKGKIYFASSQKKLIMDLSNGEIHESDNNQQKSYRRLRFTRHKIAMNAEQFTFEQTSPGGPRGDRELGAPEMMKTVDSLNKVSDSYLAELKSRINPDNARVKSLYENQPIDNSLLYLKVKQRIRTQQGIINDLLIRMEYNHREIDRYSVEIHKKYALPVACIVFVLIGAPLGTMTRKGGIGMASGISLFFFVVYWAFLIGGEKLADRNFVSPFWGIWSANFVLGGLGILLLIKTTRESITLNFDFITRFIPKSWKSQEENNENS
jgi:lipopolysaccharide export system permease protein